MTPCRWLFGLSLALAAPGTAADLDVKLLEGTLSTTASVPTSARDALRQRARELRGKGNLHALVQLHAVPDASGRQALARQGLDLGAYVPDRAWIAAIPAARLDSALGQRAVRWAIPWDAERKQHPRIKARDFATWARDPARPGQLMVFVQLHHDVALASIGELVEPIGGVALAPIEVLHGATVWLPERSLPRLAALEEVLWIEEGPAPLTPTNDGARASLRADAVIAAPYSLSGSGVQLFVFDGGTVRSSHETFDPGSGSRVTLLDASPVDSHPTHVAGTAAGDGSGSSGGRGRGVAQAAQVLSAGYEQTLGTMLFWDNAGDIQADYATARSSGADLGTNSIGSNTASNGYPCSREGDYGVSSEQLDRIVRGDDLTIGSPVLMTWSAGNERSGARGRCGTTWGTTAPPSCAKNPIHVGALNSDGSSMTIFSSWGPCDDGRLKPLVVAPGCESARVPHPGGSLEGGILSAFAGTDSEYGVFCGTSMSTPATAGVVALLIEDWRARGFGGATSRPLPALVRAMLIQTSRDLGLVGPDYAYGYGAVDAKALVDFLRSGNDTLGAGVSNWGTGAIGHGATQEYPIHVPTGSGRLVASLAWDDAAAPAFSATALINDLDLELVAPDTTVHRPWVLDPAQPHLAPTTGTNARDNQEQIVVADPQPGTWTLRVRGTSVPSGPQSYGATYRADAGSGSCSLLASHGFETGTDGWTLSGAARVAAPAAGHGSFSLRLGGSVSTAHEATLDLAVPSGVTSRLSFWSHMTSGEDPTFAYWDFHYGEVRDTSGTPLAVFAYQSDGSPRSQWSQQDLVDLTPWAGQTVRLAFRATNDSTLVTTFHVDDIQITTCTPGAAITDVGPTGSLGAQPITWTATGIAGDVDVWARPLPASGWVHLGPFPASAGTTRGTTYDFGSSGLWSEIWVGASGGQIVGSAFNVAAGTPSLSGVGPTTASGPASILWTAAGIAGDVDVWTRTLPAGAWVPFGSFLASSGTTGGLQYDFGTSGTRTEIWVGGGGLAASAVNTAPGTPTITVLAPVAGGDQPIAWASAGVTGSVDVWARPWPAGSWTFVGPFPVGAGTTGGSTYDFGAAGTVSEVWVGAYGGQVVGSLIFTAP